MKSKNMNEVDSIKRIKKINSIEKIDSFIEGDDRTSILDAAEKQKKRLNGSNSSNGSIESAPKQGEQPGPITQKTSDFKEGIEGTKKAGIGDQELGVGKETNPQPPTTDTRSYITGEDVIKTLREKGKKI